MDICGELSFPPLQLPLHLSHPEETPRNKGYLPRHASKVRAHPTQPRWSKLNLDWFSLGFLSWIWEFTSTNLSDESSTDRELKRNLDAISQKLEVGLRNTITRCIIRCLLKRWSVCFLGKVLTHLAHGIAGVSLPSQAFLPRHLCSGI